MAYANIDFLKPLLDKNGIYIPRLRGITDMKAQKPFTKEDEEIYVNEIFPYFLFNLLDENVKYVKGATVRWDLLHGRKRKAAKLLLKHTKRDVKACYDAHNRYAGKEGVLRVHARIGGNNWLYYKGYKLEKESWFIERVDDCFDSTYCDIYVRVKDII